MSEVVGNPEDRFSPDAVQSVASGVNFGGAVFTEQIILDEFSLGS